MEQGRNNREIKTWSTLAKSEHMLGVVALMAAAGEGFGAMADELGIMSGSIEPRLKDAALFCLIGVASFALERHSNRHY